MLEIAVATQRVRLLRAVLNYDDAENRLKDDCCFRSIPLLSTTCSSLLDDLLFSDCACDGDDVVCIFRKILNTFIYDSHGLQLYF